MLYAVRMADTGYRSVEIIVLNDTPGDLVIESAGDPADNGAWVDGEKPTNGSPLRQYTSRTFGVKTDDVNGSALGSFQLTGLGSSPLRIDFWNHADGTSDVNVTANNAVQGMTRAIESNEDNHTMFQVQLVPSASPPHR